MNYSTKTLYAAIAVVCGLTAATAMAREFEVEVHKGNPTELVHGGGGGRGIVNAGGLRVEHGAEEAGEVVASQEVAVPALEAGAPHEIRAEAKGANISGWRYKRK